MLRIRRPFIIDSQGDSCLAWMILVIIIIINQGNGFGAISAYVAGFIGLGDGLIQGICCFLVANAFEVIQPASPRRIVYLLPK